MARNEWLDQEGRDTPPRSVSPQKLEAVSKELVRYGGISLYYKVLKLNYFWPISFFGEAVGKNSGPATLQSKNLLEVARMPPLASAARMDSTLHR